MGIDIHNLNLLAHGQDLGVSFGRTVSIGRQALFIEDHELERHRQLRGLPPLVETAGPQSGPRYFEPLMQQWLGAKVADSVDASAYENARFIHDMNLPWPVQSAERGSYDAVLDFGCLEHVFNFPVAWRNCVDLCRVGGHIFHSLPANNLSGHGFYQFSPELFFNLYQPANGFETLGVFFAIKGDRLKWWRVADPLEVKHRVKLRNSHEVYLLVIARKLRDVGEFPTPQQSDYAQDEWLRSPEAISAQSPGMRSAVIDLLVKWGMIDAMRAARERLRAIGQSGMAMPAPDYQRVDVQGLVDKTRRR